MFRTMAILWIVSLFFVPQIRAANSGPDNTIAMVNTASVLRCRSDRTVTWMFLAVGKSVGEEKPVYQHSNVTSAFEKFMHVNRTDEGQYDLCINETKPTNAGTYFCFCGNELFRTQLIVISDLSCSIQNQTGSDMAYSNTNESVYMTCIAEYWSDWDPLMSWSSSDNAFDGNITCSTNQSAESLLILQCYSINLANLPASFMVRIHFPTQKIDNVDAINVPDILLISPIINLQTRATDIGTSEATSEATSVGSSISNQALGVAALILVVIVIACLSLTQITKHFKGNGELINRSAVGSANNVGSRGELNVPVGDHRNRGLDRNLDLLSTSSPDNYSIAAYAEIRPDVPSKNYNHSDASFYELANKIECWDHERDIGSSNFLTLFMTPAGLPEDDTTEDGEDEVSGDYSRMDLATRSFDQGQIYTSLIPTISTSINESNNPVSHCQSYENALCSTVIEFGLD